uniref:Regulator of G protein signaling 22 n=1 Tax=Anas platyrhynchos platyrhynchos TaxID=8840 RepID=A0A493TTC9_ANAPP
VTIHFSVSEPPCITEDVFEDCLATDDMLVDYFNEFLSLPTFAQPVKFNPDFGVFEVVNDAPQRLENQLKKVLHDQKPPNPIYDVIRKAKNDGQLSKKISASPVFNIDPNYNTMRLDREQAVQWIKKERLPAFLESDCYFEYRLAKLISQVEWSQTGINFIIDSNYYPWIRKEVPSPPSPEEDETSFTMKKFYVSLASISLTIMQMPNFLSPSRTASTKADDIREKSREAEEHSSVAIAETPSHTQLIYVDQKLESASKEEIACGTAEPLFSQSSSPFTVLDSTRDVREQDTEEVSLRSSSESDGADSRAAWCISHKTYDAGNRNEFERFKKFIKGTLGERYWCLWMDIERLKVLKDTTRQQRQLDRMKKFYLLSSGDYFLTSEVLFRLDLLRGDQWNIKHLRRIQPEVVKPLLLYWGPRFCVTHSTAIDTASAQLKFWHTCQERPRVDIDPFPQMVSLLPLTPKSCVPRMLPQVGSIMTLRPKPKSVSRDVIPCITLDDSTEVKYQARRKYTYAEFAAGSAVLGRSIMESMLQSLYLESRAGYYFTHFCEKSGNKLWKNSAYFWADLQAYHQLFYQETLHPFKICKQAQFLYATYIAPSASMDIGLHQRKKNMIYQKIDPAFEDLFDLAEEYILILLLEPWMKMVEADKYSYGKVELVEETRQLDSVYFRKLQALHQEKCYEINSILKKTFCLNLFVGWISCDKEGREEKSKDIKNKYLNKKYFFGPNSPATRQQQEQLMHSGGGWGQILHDRLPPAVLLEIQQCIQKRLEEQWLPLFLADEQRGAEGQAKVKDKTEDLLSQKQEKTTRMWKHVDNKWVSSSSEIIAFRKVLLNPVTANQFQRFVSLKGDLLENGVLFWQEVQKYKDLCHSHCDDATVQNKITAIIDRFINSTVPPALQIDIPTEQAQKILEHRKELGPYIFREAQMTIFALLFKFWPKFCKFQSRLDSDEILLALERKKGKKMQKKEGKTLEERLAKLQVRTSWSYSKYIEALEQERVLLKTQEDVEKNSSSFFTGCYPSSVVSEDKLS